MSQIDLGTAGDTPPAYATWNKRIHDIIAAVDHQHHRSTHPTRNGGGRSDLSRSSTVLNGARGSYSTGGASTLSQPIENGGPEEAPDENCFYTQVLLHLLPHRSVSAAPSPRESVADLRRAPRAAPWDAEHQPALPPLGGRQSAPDALASSAAPDGVVPNLTPTRRVDFQAAPLISHSPMVRPSEQRDTAAETQPGVGSRPAAAAATAARDGPGARVVAPFVPESRIGAIPAAVAAFDGPLAARALQCTMELQELLLEVRAQKAAEAAAVDALKAAARQSSKLTEQQGTD